MQVNSLFVCLMGMGVTFIGLICLIVLTVVMGKIANALGKEEKPAAPPAPAAPDAIPNRQEVIAAVAAALAEELGTDVSGIRILSFKKVS